MTGCRHRFFTKDPKDTERLSSFLRDMFVTKSWWHGRRKPGLSGGSSEFRRITGKGSGFPSVLGKENRKKKRFNESLQMPGTTKMRMALVLRRG